MPCDGRPPAAGPLRKPPPAEGGWNAFITGFSGLDLPSPAGDLPLRANGTGPGGWFGGADDPKPEALRDAWFDAPDAAAQKRTSVQIQQEAFSFVPHYPLGFAYAPAAFRKTIIDMLNGFVIFRNVRRAG